MKKVLIGASALVLTLSACTAAQRAQVEQAVAAIQATPATDPPAPAPLVPLMAGDGYAVVASCDAVIFDFAGLPADARVGIAAFGEPPGVAPLVDGAAHIELDRYATHPSKSFAVTVLINGTPATAIQGCE